ncbi:MAG: hypothetical protein WB795_19855, partial [Candidatus Acidiferrales bacterium]
MTTLPRSLLFRCLRFLFVCAAIVAPSQAQSLHLNNEHLAAQFGPRGLVSITGQPSGFTVNFPREEFSLTVDQQLFDSSRMPGPVVKQEQNGIAYYYQDRGYSFRVFYEIRDGWKFLTKSLQITDTPGSSYTVKQIEPVRIALDAKIQSTFTPAAYLPQFGPPGKDFRNSLATRSFGTFLRLQAEQQGVMLLVQNPFLEVGRNGQNTSLSYAPEMQWRKEWGPFLSDLAIIGIYRQSDERIPAKMVYEWKLSAGGGGAEDGAEVSEIQAFSDCVRQFLIHPSPNPISVEVGWTLNDYQINVATPGGQAEYKRVMDTTSTLGLRTLLYAPANSDLSDIANDADDWNWEHVTWFGLGQQIRAGKWDAEKSAIPDSVSTMLDYAKSKNIALLAYVYPSLPYAGNSDWIVSDPQKKTKSSYATLSSRDFQDFLIHELLDFKHRTGIAGYSFDYAFLNLPGSSSYSQWRGWRRVLEVLRESEPDIVIDGRQTYQMYGPWSWLAGSYPHPTGNDEQAESFTPYPDLHFDRVSADRTRFVNYWYRNYQFAPQEVIPGYMTHQTPRDVNLPVTDGAKHEERSETVYTSFRARDWDYLGFKYSVLSSIATGGWNNVFDMLPGRDPEEFQHFSEVDKSWIRHWLEWTVAHKDFLRNTRTILGQPVMDRVDGTASIIGDHGYLFLFNPNYRTLPAHFRLGVSIGLSEGKQFLLRELYPSEGKLIGKPGAGVWNYGDDVEFKLDGTTATVLELIPLPQGGAPTLVFGTDASDPSKPVTANLENGVVHLMDVAGAPGTAQEVGVLLPDDFDVKGMTVNGKVVGFVRHGRYLSAQVKFAGELFSHSQELSLHSDSNGSMTGSFVVPQRIMQQLARRQESWPIPWTKEDYQTTWLAPERLLMFVQFAEPDDTMKVQMALDGAAVELTRAYASVREHAASFVGFYVDMSHVTPDATHTIRLTLPKLDPGRFQGVFFDNVETEYTDQ